MNAEFAVAVHSLVFLARRGGTSTSEEIDLLRDGYWSNTAYAPGQEELLYLEASEVMEA